MKPFASFAVLLFVVPTLGLAEDSTPSRGWYSSNYALRPSKERAWVETNQSRERTYEEVARKPAYVELYDKQRNVSLRVYDTFIYTWQPGERKWVHVRNGRWDKPGKTPLDLARNGEERWRFETPSERAGFPRLGDDYEILAPASSEYNCISWSLGVTDRWIWPVQARSSIFFSDFDDLYTRHGYRRLSTLAFDQLADHDKVVLYAKVNASGVLEPTHAARQEADGSWTSKVGKMPLIRHLHPRDLEGGTYGEPYAVYVRARKRPNS